MKTIKVTTGFGFYTRGSNVIAKAILPIGNHPLVDDCDYIEVADKAALDSIQVYIDPIEQLRRQNETLISVKTRELSIAALKAEGKLPGDFI